MKSISAVQLLRDDHKKILGLFRQLEVIEERAPELRDAVVVELFEEFLIHSQLEERLFYPRVERLIQSDVNEAGLIEQSFVDHQEIAMLIQRYFRERVQNNVHDGSKLEEMSELVQAHMLEEEKSLFAFVEKNFSDQLLEDMGQGLLALKRDLMRAIGFRTPPTPTRAKSGWRRAKKESPEKGFSGEAMISN